MCLFLPSCMNGVHSYTYEIVLSLFNPLSRFFVATQVILWRIAESVAILAAFLGPSKAIPLIRAIELLENHFEKGTARCCFKLLEL
jgi:hypothetical protein